MLNIFLKHNIQNSSLMSAEKTVWQFVDVRTTEDKSCNKPVKILLFVSCELWM